MSSHNGIVGRSPQTSIISPDDPNFIVKANDNFSRLGQASNELQNVVNQIIINNGNGGNPNVVSEWKRFDITASMFTKAATTSDAVVIMGPPPPGSLMLFRDCYWHTNEAVSGPVNLLYYRVEMNSSPINETIDMFPADDGVTFHNATTIGSLANNSGSLTLTATTTKSGGSDINTNEITGGHATVLLLVYLLVFPS